MKDYEDEAFDDIERAQQRKVATGMTDGSGWRKRQIAEQEQGEIERLTDALKKANAQAEHFEREWYLRGDELEKLKQEQGEPVIDKSAAIRIATALGWTPPKQEQGEPVTILPDGSAFGVMSFPLPYDHWIYAPNEYRDGEYEPIDLPKPILTHVLRDEVVAAIRYAVRGATMRGQEKDFDPDALVQNAVYALCGPFTSAQPKNEQEQGEPVAYIRDVIEGLYENGDPISVEAAELIDKLYTTPQQRTWVGLDIDERAACYEKSGGNLSKFAAAIEAKLKQKNGYAEEKNNG